MTFCENISECINISTMLVIDIIYFLIFSHQILLYWKRFYNFKSKKLILFFLLLCQISFNFIFNYYNNINILLVMDILLRHLSFFFIIYIFISKAIKMSENLKEVEKKLNILKIILIISICIFFILIIIFAIFTYNSNTSCSEGYWLGLRVFGILIALFFMIVSFILIKRFLKGMDEVYSDFWNTVTKEPLLNTHNEIDQKMIKGNMIAILESDEKIYDLLKIMTFYFSSAFLSFFLTLYFFYTITQNSDSCTQSNFLFKNTLNTNIAFELSLSWVMNIINYHLPLIIVYVIFKINKKGENKKKIDLIDFIDSLTSQNFLKDFKYKANQSQIDERDRVISHASNEEEKNE